MPRILLVMRKPGNIRVLSRVLADHNFNCIGANTDEALRDALGKELAPDLALIDVNGFGKSVLPMCDMLQQANVPFIVLSAKQERIMVGKTLRYGATTVLEKPIVKASLLELIYDITKAGTQLACNGHLES